MKKGYSLLVVVIALAIFTVGILSLIALLPSGHHSVRRASFLNRATAIAERELSRIRTCYSAEDDPLPPENFSGSEPDGFFWKGKIEPYSSGKGENRGFAVTLEVSCWKEGKEERETFETKFIRK